MKFTREKIRDFYLLTTDVENIFINEYMPAAPGDFVKVYMYGLLYSQNGVEMSPEKMAEQLSIDIKRIEEAWDYWNSLGAVNKVILPDGGYDISFRQIRAMMYGTSDTNSNNISDTSENLMQENYSGDIYNKDLKNLILDIERLKGSSLSPSEIKEIFSLSEEDKATADVILCAAEYCFEKGKTGINYMAKVVREWTKEGLRSTEDVKEKLEAADQRRGFYKKILRTLGLNRGVTEAEREMIDSWVDDMQFSKDKILEACVKGSFISNPNLRYVNRVLQNWFSEAKISGRDVNSSNYVSQAVLNRYYAYLRDKAEAEAEARRSEVYSKIPRIKELDKQLLELGQNLSKVVLSGNKDKLAEIKKLTRLLEEEKAVLLTENNYREDYTDIRYACEKCGDTGITEDGGRCSCTKERMGEAELWQNLTSSEN